MPQSSRKTRERQLAKLAQRRAALRRKKQRRRLIAGIVGVAVAVLGMGYGLLALTRNGKTKVTASPTPTASASASPGADCGYTAKANATGAPGAVAPPTFTIDVAKTYTATVKTSLGAFTMSLFADVAPCTVNSFVYLADQKFYDGLTFHRIIKDFVIQGGDPAGNGSGGPGYSFNDELNNDLTYEVGTLAMANSGANTNGSQWFIVTGDQGAQLPKSYTIFGKVLDGLDVVKKIGNVETIGGTGDDKDMPKDPVTIVKIAIKESAPPTPEPTSSTTPSATPSS